MPFYPGSGTEGKNVLAIRKSSIIRIPHPGPDVNVIFPGEARPRSHPAVGVMRDADLEISLHQTFTSSTDDGVLQII